MKNRFYSRLLAIQPSIKACFSMPALMVSAALSWSLSANAETVTYNTAGSYEWFCPPGVTSIQVECWGGGGAGGAGRKDTTAGTNTSQNGAGGGGGAYARRVAVPVTPGQSYNITIPAAAVSGTNGTTTTNAGAVNGGTVTFLGDSGVTVQAAGGSGGPNAYTTSNATTGTSSGGAGGTVAGSIGDPGAVFAGGNGFRGTLGAISGQDNSSGGGGGGAGDANAGGSAVTGGTGAAGGIAGGGNGGNGRIGANTNSGVGSPGATPGGGGGGGKNVGVSTRLGGDGGLGQIVLTYTAPVNVKANNALSLNDPSSWTLGVPLGNLAKWDNTVTSANTTLLGADIIFSGIEIADPAGPVTISAGNTLTLGSAVTDIDMVSATQDLTLNCDLALVGNNTWNVASSRTLTLGGVVSGSSGVTVQGSGTTTLAGANTYTGDTVVSAGTLNLSGSLTGNGTTTAGSRLNLGTVAGNTVMNITGNIDSYLAFNGGLASGANTAINMSSGTLNFTYTGTANNINQVNSAATGSYGSLNLTGGTINTVGRTMVSAGSGGGSVYIGGTGTLNSTGDWFLLTHVNANALGSVTIGPGGTLNRAGAPNPLGVFLTAAGQYGILNLTGGNLVISAPSQSTGIRFGNGNNGNNNTGILNLAAGTYETNANIHQSVGTSTGQFVDINLAGGTLKATGNLTSALPNTVTGQTVTTTAYGPINNDGTAQDFTGGFTVDSNGNSVTLGNPIVAPSADGVARSSLTITGGSGYIGAPVVQFTGGTLAAGGAPAAGYAVVSGGQVSDIVITAPGSYTSAPTVTLTGGGGSGASVAVGTLVANTSGGLTKVGDGALILSGANTYTGTTNVTGGDLKLSSAGSALSDVVVATGAGAGARVAVADGQFASNIDMTFGNGSSLVIDYGSTAPSISVAPIQIDNLNLGSNLGLFLEGDQVSTLAVGQTYPLATWTVSGPSNGSAFTTVETHRLAGNLSVAANTLSFTVTSNAAGAISWNTGNGTWDTGTPNWLASDSTSTTYIDLLDDVLFGDATGASGNPVVTLNSTVSPRSVKMNSASHDYSISGTGGIAGSGGLTLDAANTRTLTLATANTYTGATAIAGGTLQLGNGGAGGSLSPSSNISISSGATFAVNQSDTVTQGTDFGAAAITGAGNLTKAGSGTTILNAANTYSGQTDITGGTLQATLNSTVNGVGTSAVAIGSGSTLLFDNTFTTSSGTLIVSNTFTGSGLLNIQFGANTNPRNIQLPNVAGFAGTIRLSALGVTGDKWNATGVGSVAGSLIVDAGNSLFVSSGSTAFSGGITLNGPGNSEGRGAIRVSNGSLAGDISLAGDSTINLDNTAAVLSGNISSGAAGTQTLTLGATGSTGGTLSGVIGGGTGTLNLATAVGGTYTLSNANTYTGTTTVNAGTLQLANVSALGGNNPGVNGTSSIALAGGTTLRPTVDEVTISSPISLGDAATTSTITAPAFGATGGAVYNLFLNGAISGDGDLRLLGVQGSNTFGTIRLGAASSYNGSTEFTTNNTNGTLFVVADVDNALPSTTVLTLDGGTGSGTGRTLRFDLNGFDQTLGGLTNVNGRNLRNQRITSLSGPATLTINNSVNYSFGGTVSGSTTTFSRLEGLLALTKNGVGTMTLTGASNTHSGATTVLGGILELGNTGSLLNSPLDTLASVAGDATNGLRSTVTTLTLGGLTGNKNLASVFTTTSGGYDTLTALTLNPGADVTLSYSGIIADGAAGMTLAKSGAGTQTLAGANTYTGETAITAGTLALGANGVIPDASPVSLGAATLDAGTFTDAAGALDVTGAATINLGSGGALAFGASNLVDWTGGTLNITGAFVSGSSIRFGVSSGGLDPAQIPLITIAGFTGVGIDASGFLTATAVGGYDVWAATNAGGQTADLDFDNDGTSNGVEYFMNAAAGFTANPQLNGSNTITWTNGGNIPASAYGTQFVVQTSGNMLNWTDVPVGQLTTNTDGPGGSLTYTLTGTAPRFVRLVVTPN